MNTRSAVSALLVVLIGLFAYRLYQRGQVALPGLPPTAPTIPNPTPTPPSAPATVGTPDLHLALKPQQDAILVALEQKDYAQTIALADAWLNTRPTDAVVALLRNNALGAQLAKPSLELGLSAPLTGPLKQIGEAFAQGMNLAIQEVNAKGGVRGRWVVARIVNDAGDRAVAVKAATDLLQSPVLGVVGPYSSSTTMAAKDIYNQGLAIVAPAATSPKVSGAGPYIYRVAPSDAQQGASLARLAYAHGKTSSNGASAAVLYDSSDAYSLGLADSFKSQAKQLGMNTTDFKISLNAINNVQVGNYDVDTIFVAGYTPDVAAVAKLEAGFPQRLILAGDGAYGQDLLARGGSAVEGVTMTTFYHSTANDTGSKTFTQRFQNRYGGGTPNGNSMQAYDATRTLLEAIRRAPTLNREGLRTGLESLRKTPGPGVTAPVRFDGNGDVIGRPFVVVRVQYNKFQAVGLAP